MRTHGGTARECETTLHAEWGWEQEVVTEKKRKRRLLGRARMKDERRE